MPDSANPLALVHQVPLSLACSRQEYRGGLPFHFLGGLLSPGLEPAPLMSPALAGGFFTTGASGKPHHRSCDSFIHQQRLTECLPEVLSWVRVRGSWLLSRGRDPGWAMPHGEQAEGG